MAAAMVAGGFSYSGTFMAGGASAPKPARPIAVVEETGHDVLETFLQAIAKAE